MKKNLSLEEKTIKIKEALKDLDLEKLSMKVQWSLNAPICDCQPCYDQWLNWGKRVYGDDVKGYKAAVKEEEFHREQRRLSKEIDSNYKQGRIRQVA